MKHSFCINGLGSQIEGFQFNNTHVLTYIYLHTLTHRLVHIYTYTFSVTHTSTCTHLLTHTCIYTHIKHNILPPAHSLPLFLPLWEIHSIYVVNVTNQEIALEMAIGKSRNHHYLLERVFMCHNSRNQRL